MSMYQPNIPTGLINLDVDYQNIRNNFTQLNTTFSKNHLPITDGSANNGAHTFVELRNSSGLPAGLQVQEGTLYSKLISGASQLFYTPDQSTNEYQLSATDTTNFGTFATNGNYPQTPPVSTQFGGWTYLPGGLLFQYGTITVAPNNGTASVKFPKAFATQVYSIVLTFNRTDPSSVVQTVRLSNFNSSTLNSFNFYSGSNNNVPITWMAIGL